MAEINGYLLTEEEEKACVAFVKEQREKKVFAIDFTGYVKVKAKTRDEANYIFWQWVGDLQDKTLTDWYRDVTNSPYFEIDIIEED